MISGRRHWGRSGEKVAEPDPSVGEGEIAMPPFTSDYVNKIGVEKRGGAGCDEGDGFNKAIKLDISHGVVKADADESRTENILTRKFKAFLELGNFGRGHLEKFLGVRACTSATTACLDSKEVVEEGDDEIVVNEILG